jgi:hypothetical protein
MARGRTGFSQEEREGAKKEVNQGNDKVYALSRMIALRVGMMLEQAFIPISRYTSRRNVRSERKGGKRSSR